MPDINIVNKYSTTSGNIPSTLYTGELATNVDDGIIYVGGVNSGSVSVLYNPYAPLNITSGNITSGMLGDASVVSGSIASGQVGQYHLSDNSVFSGNIASGQIQQPHLGTISAPISGYILTTDGTQFDWIVAPAGSLLTSGVVTSGYLGDASVVSGSIASGQIQQQHLGTISAPTSGYILTTDGSSFDWIVPNAGTLLTSGVVTSGYLGDASVVSGSIASGQVGQYHLSDNSVFSGQIASGQVGQYHLSDNSVFSGQIASGQIQQPHLGTISAPISGYILTTDGTQFDWIIPNAGTLLTSGVVTSGYLGDASVVSGSIASGQVGHYHISDGAVQSGNIASGQVGISHLAANTTTYTAASGLLVGQVLTWDGTNMIWEDPDHLMMVVRNNTGSTIAKGSVVYIDGGFGNKATISKASATSEATSSKTFGILQDDIADNDEGRCLIEGMLEDVDTSAYGVGDLLYLSTTAGEWTTTKYQPPVGHSVYIGTVVRSHINQGRISVKIQNGFELQELHNVRILSGTVQSGQILQYSTLSGGYWQNVMPDIGSGYISYGAINSGQISSGQVSNFHLSSGAAISNIQSGSINSGLLSDNSVVSGSIASGQIGRFHLSASTVFSGHIASGQINTFNLASGIVNSGHFAPSAIASGVIASGQINTFNLASGVVNSGHVTTNAINSGNISANAVASGAIASGQVGAFHLSSGAVVSGTIASGQVGTYALGAGTTPTSGYVLMLNGTALQWNLPPAGTPASGTISSGMLADNSVVSGSIASGQIGRFHLSAAAIFSGHIASGQINTFNLASGIVNSGHITTNAVVSGNIASNAVISGSIASGQVGAFHLSSGAVVSGTIASGQIGQNHLSANAVNSGQIAANAIASGVIASGQINRFNLASGIVNSGHLAPASVVSGSIASGQIGPFSLSSGVVASGHVTTNAINSGNINSNAVASGAIASGQVGTYHLGSTTPTSGAILQLNGTALQWNAVPTVNSGSLASGLLNFQQLTAQSTIVTDHFNANIGGETGSYTAVTLPATRTWTDVAAGMNMYVAVDNGANPPVYSYDGVNWSQCPAVTGGIIAGNKKITYVESIGVWSIVIDGGSSVDYYSYDGINFTAYAIQAPIFDTLYTLRSCGNLGIACGVRLSAVSVWYTSHTSGRDYYQLTMPATVGGGYWRDAAYGNGVTIFIQTASTNQIAIWNGTTFSTGTLPAAITAQYIIFGNGLFLITDSASNTHYYSYDNGASWKSFSSQNTNTFYPIYYAGQFLLLPLTGAFPPSERWIEGAATSTTSGWTAPSINYGGICVGADKIVIVPSSSSNTAYSSPSRGRITQKSEYAGELDNVTIGRAFPQNATFKNVYITSGLFGYILGSGSVVSGNIASGQIGKNHLSSGAVASGQITLNAINSGNISSGSIFNFLLGSGAINSGHLTTNAVVSGSIASGQIGPFSLSSGVVASGHFAPNSINSGFISANAVISGSIASGQIGPFSLSSGVVASGHLAPASIVSGNIASGQIGPFSLSSGVVASGHFAPNSINSGAIASGSIYRFLMGSGAINSGHLTTNAVVSGSIASGQIGPFSLSSGVVQSGHISNDSISSGNIASGQIHTFSLGSGVVNSGHLAPNSVNSGNISANAISSGNIASGLLNYQYPAGFEVSTTVNYFVNQTVTACSTNGLTHVGCYGNGVYVLLAAAQAQYSYDGITFSNGSFTGVVGSVTWVRIVYCFGKFFGFAISGSSTVVWSSSDGITWSLVQTLSLWAVSDVDASYNTIVAISSATGTIYYSNDGLTFTAQAGALSFNPTNIIYANTKWLVHNGSLTNLIISTSDIGIDIAGWRTKTIGLVASGATIGRMATGNGMIVAIYTSGNSYLYTRDFFSSYGFGTPPIGNVYDVCYGGGMFYFGELAGNATNQAYAIEATFDLALNQNYEQVTFSAFAQNGSYRCIYGKNKVLFLNATVGGAYYSIQNNSLAIRGGMASDIDNCEIGRKMPCNGNFTNINVEFGIKSGSIGSGQLSLVHFAPTGMSNFAKQNNFRIGLQSGVPITPTDVTGATVYLNPYNGNGMSLWDTNTSGWLNLYASGAVISATASPHASGVIYDVFAFNNAGAINIQLTSWSGSARSSTVPIVNRDGVPVWSGQPNQRLVGTVRADSSTTFSDTVLKRFVQNTDNRVQRPMYFADATSHTYSVGAGGVPVSTFRIWNNSSGNQILWVNGMSGTPHGLGLWAGLARTAGTTGYAKVSLATNNNYSDNPLILTQATTTDYRAGQFIAAQSQIGFNYAYPQETMTASGTITGTEVRVTGYMEG